jgi:hypothetical protein
VPACESTATTKSTATEVTATAKAAAMASTKAAPATMTTAAASTSTSAGEGVGLDRGHARGDDRENDCYFAQHQTLLLRTRLRPWMFSDTPRQPARSGRVTSNVGTGNLRVCARLPRLFDRCGKQFWDTVLAIGNPGAAMPDAQIRPPGASTMEQDIDGPIPMPSGFVVQNAWNRRWVSLGSLPPPSDSLLVTQSGRRMAGRFKLRTGATKPRF